MSGYDFIQDFGLVMLIAATAAWFCQRLGLPLEIGYITAGIFIGPHTHSFALISDTGRIQSLAQIGLIFLIFRIGQGIKIHRLKKVGLPLVLATVIIALMVLGGCRVLGATLGWPGEYSLVLAGMLMVSSTAVTGRSLREANATNSRFGQTALTVTALDDLVAVITLTILVSIIQVGHVETIDVLGAVVRLIAVLITMAIGALLLIPLVFNRLGRGVSSEVRSLAIVGLLLAMALLSAKAGFSAALGAFLLGTVVSSIGRNDQFGRILGDLSEVFAPVFFVAMGMLFDFKMLAEIWSLMLGVFCMVVVWRMIAATAALLMTGRSMGDAIRAGLCLTPIGEFSLMIALTGVQGGLVPKSFYALAVGVCLLTSLTTPLLIRKSGVISEWFERKQPSFLAQWNAFYHDWIERMKHRQRSSLLWQFTGSRIIQVSLLVLFISGLLLFARPLYSLAEKWRGSNWPFKNALPLIFWFCFGVLLLPTLIALWRNIEALSMIFADSGSQGWAQRDIFRPLFENLLKGSVSIAILVWLGVFIPYAVFPMWALAALVLVLLALAAAFWRHLIRLHSRLEIELQKHLADSPFVDCKPHFVDESKCNSQWKLNLAECTIKENAHVVACPISDLPLRRLFSCTIVSIERQGVRMSNPDADTMLFPNDKVFLLGQDENLCDAEQWLNSEPQIDEVKKSKPMMSQQILEHLVVPQYSSHAGKALEKLKLNSLFGIQVIGIKRIDRLVLSPGRSETMQSGDQLLVLGMPEQISELAFWLAT